MKPNLLENGKFDQKPSDPAFVNNPYALYEQLHRYGGPVFWNDYNMWCLTEFDAVNSALRSRNFARLPPEPKKTTPVQPHMHAFAQAEQFSLLALEPPEHTRIRKFVNNAFINRQIQQLEPHIEQLANELIDQFIGDRSVELLAHYATPIPVQIIAKLIGVPREYCPQLLDWSHAMVKVYTMTQSHQDEVDANKAAQCFVALLKELIAQSRKHPANNLLSHLSASATEKNGLSDEEICSVCILLLNAGHEATVHQIGNATFTLLNQASETNIEDLFSNPLSCEKTVTELMRVDAPLHLFTRYAQNDTQLSDNVKIKRGEQIALLLGAANRDPKKFERPALFDPNRHNSAHVSLGAGIHFCVGAALAKMEIQIALKTLFKRIPNLKFQHMPHYKNSYHFHGLDALHLSW